MTALLADKPTIAVPAADGPAEDPRLADPEYRKAIAAAQRRVAKTASERVRSAACMAYVRAVGHDDLRPGAGPDRLEAGKRRLAAARAAYRAAGGKPALDTFEDLLSAEELAEATTPHPVVAAFRSNRYADAVRLAVSEGIIDDVDSSAASA